MISLDADAEPSSKGDLGLNEHHQNALFNYMRFAKYLRGQHLRSVDTCFLDIKNSRLLESTYTLDEVTDLLNELATVVRAEVESELINVAHSNAVLLQNLFSQAEKWHLKLQADTSDLENRELLDKVKEFERHHKERPAVQGSPVKHRLEPLNDMGSAALLQQEIDRLQEDNMKLRQRLKTIESQATALVQDRNSLSESLQRTKGELQDTRTQHDELFDREVSTLSQQLSEANTTIGALEKSSVKQEEMEKNLTAVKHQLLKVHGQLELAEKELEKQVGQTTPYMNLKKMLQQKNDLVKTLRKQLEKYEPSPHEDDAN